MDYANRFDRDVVAPFGLKGELRVRLQTDFPERFDAAIAPASSPAA